MRIGSRGVRPVQGLRGHQWIKDSSGAIDEFAYDGDYCNGPRCEKCGFYYCEHCADSVDEIPYCTYKEEESN